MAWLWGRTVDGSWHKEVTSRRNLSEAVTAAEIALDDAPDDRTSKQMAKMAISAFCRAMFAGEVTKYGYTSFDVMADDVDACE